MAENEVNIVIKAQDEASKVIGGITNVLGGLGKIAFGAALGGIAAVGTGLVLAVKDAAEEQVVLTNMQKVIEGTGKSAWISADQVESMAVAFEKTTRFSHDATIAASGVLLKFTNIGQDIFPQTIQTTLDMAEALGMDATSAAQTLGRALEVPGEGLLRLKTLGVSFTKDQQEQIKAMVEAGDTAGAQKIILDALATSYNGVAAAAGNTLSGKITILKNVFGSLAEDIGASLLPMLTDLVQKYLLPLIPVITQVAQNIATWLPGAIQQVINWIQVNLMPVLQQFGDWFITIGWPAIQQFVGVVISQLIPGLMQLWTWIQQGAAIILPLLSQAWDFLSQHMNIVLPILAVIGAVILALTSPISLVVGAIVLFATAWANNWGGIRDTLTNIWNNYLNPVFTAIKDFLSVAIPLAINILKGFWDNILLPTLQAIWNFINTYIIPIFKSWYDAIGGITGAVQTVIGWITSLTTALSNIHLPDWLMPGSPTPFEIGLRGIANAMKDLNGLTTSINMVPAMATIGNNSYTTNQNNRITNNYNIHTNALPNWLGRNYNMAKASVG